MDYLLEAEICHYVFFYIFRIVMAFENAEYLEEWSKKYIYNEHKRMVFNGPFIHNGQHFMGEYICTEILSKLWIRFFYFRFCYHLNHIFIHDLCFLFSCSIQCLHRLSMRKVWCINRTTYIELKYWYYQIYPLQIIYTSPENMLSVL